jgi:hypothetical protein
MRGVVVGFGVVTTTGAGGLPPPAEDIQSHFHFNVVLMLECFAFQSYNFCV